MKKDGKDDKTLSKDANSKDCEDESWDDVGNLRLIRLISHLAKE